MQTEKTRHLRTRVISVLLAVLMIVTCLPSMLFPVSADNNGRSGGPLVLTNASVEFRDDKYNPLDEVDTGAVFYLMSTISGNNVNEGEANSYRIEITDKNLLLPNFAGNGFRDGAVYNGYTLHVNSDGSRYITFDITNGQTKQVRLQAKFQNGKTPGGTISTVKIVQDSTGKNASSTITAKAERQWSASKSEDRNALTAAQLAAGTTVNYTLSASANNVSKKNGVEWVQSLKFEDTISLSEMTFTGDAQTAVENAVKSAIAAAGYTAGNLSVTVSGSTAKISFTVDSKNTNAEMSAVKLHVALPLNSSTVKMNGTADGKVTNSLTVSGKPYGDDTSYSTIGGNSVELKVSAPQGPKFSIGKTVQNGKAYYVNGDTVEFEISASNTGDAAGDITLTDTVPDGMTLESITAADGTVSGNSVTFQNVAAGATVTARVVCKVSKDQTANLTNEVTDGKNTAKATISVKEDKAVIETPVKSGFVTYNGKNLGQKYYPHIAGQTATYTISVTNSGAKDAKGVLVSDDSLSYNLENMTYTVDGVTRSDFPDKIDVPAGKTVQITVTGTIRDDVAGEISNVAKVDGKSSNKVKFTPDIPKAQLGITKTVDKSSYVAGDTLTYTIVIENNGTAAANGVTFSDAVPDALENVKAWTKQVGYAITTTKNAVESSGDWKFVPGKKVTITITGTVKTDTTGEIVNQAQCGYDGSTIKSNEVKTTKDTSGDYKAEKWIVDENGNVLVDTDDSIKSGFQGFSEGDKAGFRVRFTNLTGATVNGLKMADGWYRQTSEDARTTGKVISCTGTYTGLTDLGTYYWKNDANKNTTWGYEIPADQLTLAPGQSIEIEYTMTMNNMSMAGAGSNYYRNYVAFYPLNTWNKESGMWGETTGSYAATSVNVPYDFCFNTEKSASPNKKEISDLSQNDLEIQEFTNTITLKPNTQDTTDYYGKTFTLTDVLPDGMTLADGDLSQVISVTNGTLDTSASKLDGNQLTIAFTSATSLNGSSSAVTITYKTKLTSDGAQKLYDTIAKSTTLTNTVTNVVVKDGETVLKDKTPNATADISFTKTTPAPGFAKLAVASFAGQTYDDTAVQPVGNGYITAGDTLIWQTVLYNGRGNSTDVADLKLDGVTLTDNLPATYQFSNKTGLKMTYQVLDLNYDDTEKASTFETDANGLLKNGTPISENDGVYEIKDNGTKLVIHADKLATKLEKNKCIVFQFATTVKDGQESEGVITNTGYATIDQPFSTEDTVAGEKQDNQIWSYANYNIVGLTTESWKTITYTNQNHTGTPHTDPATDTGYSRQPTHNYVQGMQGEDVTYELHIKNNSPVDLENMTIIDRLPYVGDLGLVSGYERFSAFGVTLKSIDSVTVGGTDVSANAAYSYSTDKTSVLNEYSKDWLGQNDVMNWTSGNLSVAPPADTVDFRIQLQDTTVKVGEEVVVKVTATVPSYVAKTGEENIAWNSFAYSYQNTDILGDTVMVAEPAKVGVWVQTPDTTVDVTVNKTLTEAETKDATFYFALFTDENYTTRLSDVISVTIPAGQTEASVTMKDVDLSSIKQQMIDAHISNADNVYLLETDAKGNQIHNYTPAYTYNKISTTDATTDQTVGVTNTKNTGDITLKKTLAGVEGGNVTGDTFYFALFTKNAAGEYVRYEEAPVQSLTFTEAGSQDVIFKDVPKGVDFYVLETNANGVLADQDFTKYTSDAGIAYTIAPVPANANEFVPADAKANAGDTVSITNIEEPQYSITVSKVLIADDVKSTPAFSVGLFTKNGNDYTQVGTTKNVIAGSDVTFDGLKEGIPYYIFEMDGDKRVENGASFQMPVVLDPKNSTTKTDTTFYVSYDCCDDHNQVAALTLTKDAPQTNTIITNTTKNPAQIKVTKIATIDDNPADSHEATVALFTMDADGNYQAVSGQKKTITIAAGNKGKNSVTFDGLDSSKTYYVFELDADGKRVENESTISVGGKTFLATYSGNSNRVDLLPGIPGEKVITDANTTQVELSFAKVDVKGNAMAGCEMTLTGPNGYSVSWETTADSKKITGLAAGDYTLTEKSMTGYAPVSISFTVNADGYIVTTDAQGNPITGSNFDLTENGLTVINRSQISVSKKDITSLKELAGAKITITKTDGSWNEALVELSRTGTTFTKSDSVDDESQYQLTSKELTFISDDKNKDGENKTNIIGLPDGTYTMTEVVAPDGYNKVSTDFTFAIKNGVVDATGTTEYDVSGNDITMKDGQKPSVTISKQAVGGGEELTGAVLKLTAPAGTDLSKVKGSYSDGSTAGIETSGNTITWTSDKAKGSVTLENLPAGVYTLEETTAPDGFTKKTEEMNFEVGADGKVGTVNGLTKDDNKIVMEDDTSKLTIGKRDITGQQEVTGAKLTLTLTKPDESGATLDDVTANIRVDSRTEDSITWTSGKTDAILSKLPDGKYTLKETGGAFTDAETGGVFTDTETGKTYAVIESTMTFTVENGVVTDTNAADSLKDKATEGYYYCDKTAGQILVCDAEAVNVVPISKQDAGSGAEVAGATLEITAENVLDTTKLELSRTDKNGNKTVLVKGTDYSISTDGKTIQFVSGEDATIITGLPAGSYQLRETNAPDGYQLYTAEETFTIGTDGKVTGTTTIQDEVSKLTIGKRDITGKQEVTGATLTLKLTNPDESGATLDGVKVENVTVGSRTADSITWTSGKTNAILSKLPDGTYTLGESGEPFVDEETKKTYTVIESTMTFTVKNGVVTSTTGDADKLKDRATEGYYYCDKTTGQILVCDAEAVNVVPISKQDAGSGAEVAGATLEITAENVLDTTKLELSRTDKNGNKTVLVKGTDYSISTDGKTIQFVSGEDATIITGLPAGSYQLRETNAPDGYQLYTAEETFTIGTDGKVTGTTTIQDEVSKLTIGKRDITGQQEVTGATLTLTLTNPDESGATLDDVTANIHVDSRTADSITWTSGKTDAILSKLPDGKYTLKETGDAFTDTETGKTYTVIESTMTFTVENGVVTSTTGDADKLNDKATEGYYYYDKTAGQILVCDAEQPAITTTSTSETTTTTTTTTTTATSESSTTSDTETTTGTGTVTTVSTVATTSKTSGTTTEVTTDTTLATSGTATETSAGPTTTSTSGTTTEVTTVTTLATSGTATETSAGPTTTSTSGTTTEVTTDTTLATSGNTTETSAGPTTTSASETTTEVTTDTTLATSGNTTETSAGPTTTSTSGTTTEVTTVTTLATSGNTTETSAGSTTTSTNGTTTDTTTTKTTVTTASASTETSAASTTATAARTTTETVTETSTTAASTATTAETTVTTAATTTIEATTTTTEETTVETTTEETTEATTTTEETTTTIVTTTEQPDGYVIRKCDVGGNEIGGASLNITDQSGNVIDQWVSEEGVSHVFAGIQPNTPYCLTETLAPADYLVAEPIYFQLNEDGTLVLFVGVSLNEDGSWSVENAVVTANPDGRAIVMIDEYVGTETTTTETTEETTTTTEATTTTAKNTTAGNGEHTPSVSTTTTASTETTTVTGESGTGTTAGSDGSGTTTAAGGSQTTTVIRSSSGSSSSSSRSNTKISSTPKTGEALPVVIIPAGIALAAAIVVGCKRKKK
ncbi:SpaA isopeptide-forming pilin-related protein [Ruminococcus sp.]